jgi:hypothetical protein
MSSTDPAPKAGNGSDKSKGRSSIARAIPRNQIAVSRGGGMVIIRVIGAGNMLTVPSLNEFAERQLRDGFKRFVFDLQPCQALDSTFMGCMVGLANGLKKESIRTEPAQNAPPDEQPGERIEEMSPEEALATLRAELAVGSNSAPPRPNASFVVAINASPEVLELLGILGVDKFVPLLGHLQLPEVETTVLPTVEMTPEERRLMILKAHENLVEIDKRNEAQFGAFLKSLSSELSKPRPGA